MRSEISLDHANSLHGACARTASEPHGQPVGRCKYPDTITILYNVVIMARKKKPQALGNCLRGSILRKREKQR